MKCEHFLFTFYLHLLIFTEGGRGQTFTEGGQKLKQKEAR